MPETKEKMKNLKVPEDTWKIVKVEAAKTNTPMYEWVAEAVKLKQIMEVKE